MIDLGSTEFYLAVPSIPAQELESLSTLLFDDWAAYIDRSLVLTDYSLFLQVEEGSIKGAAKVGALLGAIYFGIGNYGDFISGVKTINEQLSSTRDYLTEHAGQIFNCTGSATKSRKSGGSLASIQRLFVKVQRGELTPDQAVLQAEVILGEESTGTPSFIRELENSLRNCPRYHEQMDLPLDEIKENQSLEIFDSKRTNKPTRPKSNIPPPLQFRVEVWRESKDKRKQTRVTQF